MIEGHDDSDDNGNNIVIEDAQYCDKYDKKAWKEKIKNKNILRQLMIQFFKSVMNRCAVLS